MRPGEGRPCLLGTRLGGWHEASLRECAGWRRGPFSRSGLEPVERPSSVHSLGHSGFFRGVASQLGGVLLAAPPKLGRVTRLGRPKAQKWRACDALWADGEGDMFLSPSFHRWGLHHMASPEREQEGLGNALSR